MIERLVRRFVHMYAAQYGYLATQTLLNNILKDIYEYGATTNENHLSNSD